MTIHTYPVVSVGGTFLSRQQVSMDIGNHRLGLVDHRSGTDNDRLGIRNHHVGVGCQLGLGLLSWRIPDGEKE